MDIKQAIFERKSIRSFTDAKVEDEKIESLITSALYAPSASNKQAWKYIVIDDEEVRRKICSHNGGVFKNNGSNLILQAPTGILVLYRNDVSRNYRLYKDHIQSAAASIQNILLTAHSIGLGACWICKLPRQKYLKKLLNIPKFYSIIAYVAVGYPNSYLTQHTVYHYDGDHAKAVSRSRKYSVSDVVSHNRYVDHNNYRGTFKFPFILSILHYLQLGVKNDGSNKIGTKLLSLLFNLFGVKLSATSSINNSNIKLKKSKVLE